MRIAFVVHTPGQANFWQHQIMMMKDRGHAVAIVAREDGLTCDLLSRSGLEVNVYGKASTTRQGKLAQLPLHTTKCLSILRKLRPDIILGFGLAEAYSSFVLQKPLIVFEDSEPNPMWGLERAQWKRIAKAIITPDGFALDFGKKHVRVRGYKELAYLHPDLFRPDPTIIDKLGVKSGEKYVIIRLNNFDAVHDIGQHGFSISDQLRLVSELGKYARVFVSPEGRIIEELKSSILPIPRALIHHALYYAELLVSDTQTMTTEAAVLGTPAVRSNSWVGPRDMSNFVELENTYGLIYSFQKAESAIQKALQLIEQPDLKTQWARKRDRLLADKCDVAQFMVEFVENFPRSLRDYKNNERLSRGKHVHASPNQLVGR